MKEFLDQVSDSEEEERGKEAESDNEMELTEIDAKVKELAKEEESELKRCVRERVCGDIVISRSFH